MRKLTIIREKSFVACLSKMKIYVEDPNSCELVIHGIPCRKLGEIGNGEEKSFDVEERSHRIFVIAGKSSMKTCNELYLLPDGVDDITLTGRNRYNPSTGNAFRFDNNFSEEAIANRAYAKKRGKSILAAFILIGFFIGLAVALIPVSGIFASDKTFEKDGMSITLTTAFEETTLNGYDYNAVYDSRHVALFVIKEELALFDESENYTLDEYIDIIIDLNDIEDPKKGESDGLSYFEYRYTDSEEDITYKYISFAFKTDDAFWLFQFAEPSTDAYDYSEDIFEWAKTIKFEQ